MSDETRQAIDTLARWALHCAAEDWIEDGWENNLPVVNESDYERVANRMTELFMADVTVVEYRAALKVLADRAETTT